MQQEFSPGVVLVLDLILFLKRLKLVIVSGARTAAILVGSASKMAVARAPPTAAATVTANRLQLTFEKQFEEGAGWLAPRLASLHSTGQTQVISS